MGYHGAFIYRENCYQCPYAQRRRIGDLTIADYHGLGKMSVYNGNKDSVSCILINTEKGKKIVNKLIKNRQIEVVERPILEPLENEPQFNQPSSMPLEHNIFIDLYEEYKNFDLVADIVLKKYKFKRWILGTTNIISKKNKFISMLPWELKKYVKSFLRRE